DEDERDVGGPRQVVEPLDDPLNECSHAPSAGSSLFCLPPKRNPLMVIITGLIAVSTAYSWVTRLTRMATIQTAQMPKANRILSRSMRSRSSSLERFAVELDRLGIEAIFPGVCQALGDAQPDEPVVCRLPVPACRLGGDVGLLEPVNT